MKADYYLGDLYPNLSYFSTRATTVPEAQDQSSMVDNQKASYDNPININPEKSRSIWVTVIVIILIIAILGVRF